MTKDDLIAQIYGEVDVTQSINQMDEPISNAMDTWAKQQAIAFAQFRDLYHREQRRKVKEEEKRLGGMITWDYSPDDYIYDQFIEQQQNK